MEGGRTFLSVFLALVAGALTFASLVTGWAHHELADSDQWTQTTLQVLQDPAVQEATAEFLADELVTQAEAQGLANSLPPALQGLAGTATSTLHSLAERTALSALQNRSFDDLWATAARDTHAEFQAWLTASGTEVAADQPSVTLDLRPALERLARRVGVPESVISAASSSAVNTDIQLIRAGEYEASRTKARALEKSATASAVLAILAALLSIAVATRRLWATFRIGAAVALAGAAVLALAPTMQTWVVDELVNNGSASAVANAIWRTTEPDLTRLAWIAIIGGGVVALLAGGAAGLIRREES